MRGPATGNQPGLLPGARRASASVPVLPGKASQGLRPGLGLLFNFTAGVNAIGHMFAVLPF